jgi:citrate lyase subunit beta/citryl-CoA lyase
MASERRSGLNVRVNAQDYQWYVDDVAAIAPARPDAILLPKCTGPGDLLALDRHLEALEAEGRCPVGAIGILALVTETATSLRDMDYRGITPRLRALAFGAEDLAADFRVNPRDAAGRHTAPVAAARALLLIESAQTQVPAIDTPWPDPRDYAGLRAEVTAAVQDGFSGKLCIHPDQVAPVTEAFTPSPQCVRWATEVRRVFKEAPGTGVLTLDGRMIDRPHLKLAERILSASAEDSPGRLDDDCGVDEGRSTASAPAGIGQNRT